MSGSAIEALAFSIKEAFKSVPKRGLEIGGLLLGRVESDAGRPERPVVVIEDFEPVDSEHQHGPSWLLSPSDRLALQASLERWRSSPAGGLHPVGFFRSHTRPDFGFDAQDQEIFGGGERSGEPVFLLVRPSHSELPLAQIGIRLGNALTGAATFPLSVHALRESGLLAEEGGSDHPAGSPKLSPKSGKTSTTNAEPIAPAPRVMDSGSKSLWDRSRWGVLGSAGAVGIAALALALLWPLPVQPVRQGPRPAAVVPVPALPHSEKDAAILSGDTQTDSVQDTKAPQEGATEFAPEPVWETAPHPVVRRDLPDEEQPRSKWVPIPQPSAPQNATPRTAVPDPSQPQPSPFQTSTPPVSVQERPVRPTAAENRADSSVSTDPVRPSRAGRILKTLVPLRWAGFKSGTHRVAARPIVQIKPSISPALAKGAHAEEAVDVKVQVRANGQVSRADVVSAPENSLLSEPARLAARQWVFEPARVADRPVDSSVIIHFRLHESR
jgi:TonB family protein